MTFVAQLQKIASSLAHYWLIIGSLRQQSALIATMHLSRIPFEVVDWSTVDVTEHAGDAGIARWRTRHFGDVRVRMVEYSPGYVANHWCSKGHVLLCLSGELETELQDGRRFTLTPGMSYQVADNDAAHRSMTHIGATLFVVD